MVAVTIFGQGALAASPAADDMRHANVGAEDVVITINGFCTTPPPQGDACKTVVSRAQFERLTEALQPGMSPDLRLKVANSYARLVRMAAVAEERGLDKTAAFAEEMRYARMQLLAQDLTRLLQKESAEITNREVETYYQAHASSFEIATLARIFVPRAKRSDEEMTQIAAALRERAAAGEDMDKLQIDAYATAGMSLSTAPNTRLESVRRVNVPPLHESVMDMSPGDVSPVFSDPGGGYFIYKMIARRTPPLDALQSEIRGLISQQRYRDSMRPFEGNVVLNDAYFAPSQESAPTPARARSHRGHMP